MTRIIGKSCFVGSVVVAAIIVLLLVLRPGVWFLMKWYGGKAMVWSRTGFLEVTMNGRNLQMPCFGGDGNVISLAHDMVFDNDRDLLAVWVDGDDETSVYWLSHEHVYVTRCGYFRGAGCLFNRWMLLTEVALNQTYDVVDDMKGHAANVSITENGNARQYRVEYGKDGNSVVLIFDRP